MRLHRFHLNDVVFLLLIFYPILPMNKYIGPLSLYNINTILIVGVYFLGNRSIVRFFHNNSFHWMYLCVYALFCLITDSIMSGIAWIFSTILVSIVIINVIRDENDVQRCINGLAIGSFLMSVIGFIETATSKYLIQGELYAEWSDRLRYGLLRCSGPFGHPINFAFYQAIVALILFHQINTKHLRQKYKRRYVLVYLLAVASIMCTVSRLPILFFLAAQGIYILQMGLKKAIKYSLVAILAIFIFLMVAEVCGISVFSFIFDLCASLLKLLGINNQIDYSAVKGFGNRVDLFTWVFDAVGNDWIFGKGIEETFAYEMTGGFIKTSIEVHYLYIFFKCGAVGLFFLLAGYINTLLFLRNTKERLGKEAYKKSFIRILSIVFPLYYVCLFGVQETDTTRIMCEIIAIGIASVRGTNIEKVSAYD